MVGDGLEVGDDVGLEVGDDVGLEVGDDVGLEVGLLNGEGEADTHGPGDGTVLLRAADVPGEGNLECP